MQHHTRPDGTLIVTATSGFFDWLLLGAAVLCTVPTMREALQGSFVLGHATPLIGTAFFLFGFLISFERGRFEFDPTLQVIRGSADAPGHAEKGLCLLPWCSRSSCKHRSEEPLPVRPSGLR